MSYALGPDCHLRMTTRFETEAPQEGQEGRALDGFILEVTSLQSG